MIHKPFNDSNVHYNIFYWQLLIEPQKKNIKTNCSFNVSFLLEPCEYTNTRLSPIKIVQFRSSNVTVARNQR